MHPHTHVRTHRQDFQSLSELEGWCVCVCVSLGSHKSSLTDTHTLTHTSQLILRSAGSLWLSLTAHTHTQTHKSYYCQQLTNIPCWWNMRCWQQQLCTTRNTFPVCVCVSVCVCVCVCTETSRKTTWLVVAQNTQGRTEMSLAFPYI